MIVRLAWTCLLVVLIAPAATGPQRAGDRINAVSPYTRDRWGVDKGYPGGGVFSIAQTRDGYLWIGSENGLVRFDGLGFRLVPVAPGRSVNGQVLGLMADSDGGLWVRQRGRNLFHYRNDEFDDVLWTLHPREAAITAMCLDTGGELLMSGMVNGTLKYHHGNFETIAPITSLPRTPVTSMVQTADGTVWLGTTDSGLLRVNKSGVTAITAGLKGRKILVLLYAGDGNLWIGTDHGVLRWNGAEITTDEVLTDLRDGEILSFLKDRAGNLWVGTGSGLVILNAERNIVLDERNETTPGAVTALFEDREGNIWAGRDSGIERFEERTFRTFSSSAGFPSSRMGAILAGTGGHIWFAPLQGGFGWFSGGKVGSVAVAGLDNDVVYSIAGDDSDLWIGRKRGGLSHLAIRGDSPEARVIQAKTYTEKDGLAQNSVYAVLRARDGVIWAGTLNAGVSRFNGNSFTTYNTGNGLPSNTIASISEGSDGTMWFGTPQGLSSLAGGHWRTWSTNEGLPSPGVVCVLEDSAGVVWIGTTSGIAFLSKGGRIQAVTQGPASLREQTLGLAADRTGYLWIATSSHVLRVSRDKLLRGPLENGDVRDYGIADGLLSTEGVRRQLSVVTDSAGRILFSLNLGLSVVDPARLTRSNAPAIVHIQELLADGGPVSLAGSVRVPAGPQRITFGYTGLSLAGPERVRFRYRLDNYDRDWSEPTATREAPYTNLGPGSYRFHVIASNSNGTWNGSEAAIGFQIQPFYWQRVSFRLFVVLFIGAAALAFYRMRLKMQAKQLSLRFEARLAERTRIARELHDTLLQGFLSASMQAHVAADILPDDSPAKPTLTRALELMREVIDEGRNAVRGLRSSRSVSLGLEDAFSQIQQELGSNEPDSNEVAFRVIVEGDQRPLHPILRDELYRIGREALINAFRHAHARTIEMELKYSSRGLRILVRDDGCGIEPGILRSGKSGHWGLAGMRERANHIGARLDVMSSAASGTEIEISVPSSVAFQMESRGAGWWSSRRRARSEDGVNK